MTQFSEILKENRRTLVLAAPIMAGQFGQMLMGWADTIMVGHLGVLPLAGCAFANAILMILLVFGFGLLSSVAVRASHAHGARNPRAAGDVLRAGTLLGAGAGVIMAVLIHAALPFLDALGQPAGAIAVSRGYLVLVGWSLVPALVLTSGKHFAEALSRPWLPFWIMMGGVLFNVLLNWILIYGNLGAPAMGLAGAGLATLLARVATVAALFFYLVRSSRFAPSLPVHFARGFRLAQVGDLLRIGLPAGCQHLSEVGAFATASLMMGWIGLNALAAHQIAITCAATAFMFPLGLAMAVTVRIGQSLGASDPLRIRSIGFGAMGLSLLIMAGTAALFLLAGKDLASWFVTDPAVVGLAASLLIVAGLFQLVDGIQVVAMGALRGMADVHVPMGIAIFSYWGVALPVSYGLAFHAGLGAIGVWTGLAIGLAVAAVILTARFSARTRRIIQNAHASAAPAI